MNILRYRSKSLLIAALLFIFIAAISLVPTYAQNNQKLDNFVYTVQRGDTLILIALHYNVPLVDIILANHLTNPHLVFPGQKLLLPGAPPPNKPFPENRPQPAPPFVEINLSEPTIIQGRTLVVSVTLSEPASLSGAFEGRPLFFEDAGPDHMWSLIPIHALAEPNVYPIALTATLGDGREINTFTNVTVVEGPYGVEEILLDDDRSDLLTTELIEQEREKLVDLWSQLSPRPRWEGPFRYPVAADALRITSNFGTRRSYNDSPTATFHGGTDFGGDVGIPIYAPAGGRVVLAERLTIRGNAVLIDHGLGLFSGYWHQSQLAVVAGQELQPGDLLGYLGETGLVTGPHLHWEMRLQGIAVDPIQWIKQAIP